MCWPRSNVGTTKPGRSWAVTLDRGLLKSLRKIEIRPFWTGQTGRRGGLRTDVEEEAARKVGFCGWGVVIWIEPTDDSNMINIGSVINTWKNLCNIFVTS